MQVLWLSQSICHAFDTIIRNFVWRGDDRSHGLNLLSWDALTLPRQVGGLGLRDTRLANVSLIGKLIWKLLHENFRPWVSILQQKYIPNGNVLSCNEATGCSYVWHRILKTVKYLKDGWKFKINYRGSSS